MILPSFMPPIDTEDVPAVGQALGSRMGHHRGQDTGHAQEMLTDHLNRELHRVVWAAEERLLSNLVEGMWWSGQVPREHSSIFMIQEVSPNGNRNDEHFLLSRSILYS